MLVRAPPSWCRKMLMRAFHTHNTNLRPFAFYFRNSCNDCADRFQCHCINGKWTCAELAFACFQPCFDPNATCPILLDGQFAPSGKCAITADKTCSYGKTCWYVPMDQQQNGSLSPSFFFLLTTNTHVNTT